MDENRLIIELIKEAREDVKEINQSMVKIHETLAGQAKQIEHHIKRTDLSEARLQLLEQHSQRAVGGLKVIMGLGLFFALVEFVLKYF